MSDLLLVLYVEDEQDIRDITEFALEDEGFELCICASPNDALARAPALHPQLILLDVMMPEMDGPSLLNHLREYEHLKDTPAIFMTAKVQAAERQSYLDMGAIGVIDKPFDAMTLADDVRQLLLEGAS